MNLLILAAVFSAPLAQQSAAPLSASVPPAPRATQPAAQSQREQAPRTQAPDQTRDQAQCQQPALAPPVQWVGADSKHNPGFFYIQDAAAWQKLWAAHLGLPNDTGSHGAYDRHFAPHVDFDRYLAIAYFRGPSTNHDGEVVSSITNTHKRPCDDKGTPISVQDFYPPPTHPPLYTLIRFESSTFQTASFNGADSGVATTPYGIWLIPLPPASTATTRGNEFIIQEGRRSLKGEPIRYEQVCILPGC